MRNYYAFSYPAGIGAVHASDGTTPWRDVLAFDSKSDRDAYVAAADVEYASGARRVARYAELSADERRRFGVGERSSTRTSIAPGSSAGSTHHRPPSEDRPMTTAERIAERFNNDGECFQDRDDVELVDVCEDFSVLEIHDGFAQRRFVFMDDSVITIAGDAWDIGYRGCFCWRGNGEHIDDCPNSSEE